MNYETEIELNILLKDLKEFRKEGNTKMVDYIMEKIENIIQKDISKLKETINDEELN